MATPNSDRVDVTVNKSFDTEHFWTYAAVRAAQGLLQEAMETLARIESGRGHRRWSKGVERLYERINDANHVLSSAWYRDNYPVGLIFSREGPSFVDGAIVCPPDIRTFTRQMLDEADDE